MNHYRPQMYELAKAYDLLVAGQPIEARHLALPTISLLNSEIVEAARQAFDFQPAYREIYLNSHEHFKVLQSPAFERTSLSSVTVLGFNIPFGSRTGAYTCIGTMVRNGKQYDYRDSDPNPRAVKALAFLASIVALRRVPPTSRALVVSAPSSAQSTNMLPSSLAELVCATNPLKFEKTPRHAIRRVRDYGQLKAIPDPIDRMAQVKLAMSAESAVFQNRYVLILDDLLQTGATLQETARALQAAGAREVHAITMESSVRFARRILDQRV